MPNNKAKRDIKKGMHPVASTGLYSCKNCFNDVSLALRCQVCGHPLRGFLFEAGNYAEIITFLSEKQSNRLQVFYFGNALQFELTEGPKVHVYKKAPAPKKPGKAAAKKKAPGKKKAAKKKPTKKLVL